MAENALNIKLKEEKKLLETAREKELEEKVKRYWNSYEEVLQQR